MRQIISFVGGIIFWGWACPAQAVFGGFQFGLTLGGAYMGGKHAYITTANPLGNTNQHAKLKDLSYAVGGYVAYLLEFVSTKMVLGPHLNVFAAGPSQTIQLQIQGGVNEGRVQIQSSGGYTISLLAGSMLNPRVMAYGLLGYERSVYQLQYTFNAAGTALGLPNAVTYNKRLAAFSFGLGGSYKFSPNFLISGELQVPFFKRFRPVSTGARLYNMYPRQYRLIIKLGYLF